MQITKLDQFFEFSFLFFLFGNKKYHQRSHDVVSHFWVRIENKTWFNFGFNRSVMYKELFILQYIKKNDKGNCQKRKTDCFWLDFHFLIWTLKKCFSVTFSWLLSHWLVWLQSPDVIIPVLNPKDQTCWMLISATPISLRAVQQIWDWSANRSQYQIIWIEHQYRPRYRSRNLLRLLEGRIRVKLIRKCELGVYVMILWSIWVCTLKDGMLLSVFIRTPTDTENIMMEKTKAMF